jgi:hypothetical protein
VRDGESDRPPRKAASLSIFLMVRHRAECIDLSLIEAILLSRPPWRTGVRAAAVHRLPRKRFISVKRRHARSCSRASGTCGNAFIHTR